MRADIIQAHKVISGIYDKALPNLLADNSTSVTTQQETGYTKVQQIHKINISYSANCNTEQLAQQCC